jgi:hypothetical protein
MTSTYSSTTAVPTKVRRKLRLWRPSNQRFAEYTDDSEIIPRSSSVVVKRRPAARPGKGKASMYIAGASNSVPTSEPVQRSGSGATPTTWHKGAMSKRFDVKEEPSSAPQPSTVGRPPIDNFVLTRTQAAKPAAAEDDEASAMEAMFKAQSANWEETQAKMSQLVLPLRLLVHVVAYLMNPICFFLPLGPFPVQFKQCAAYLQHLSWNGILSSGWQNVHPSPGSGSGQASPSELCLLPLRSKRFGIGP